MPSAKLIHIAKAPSATSIRPTTAATVASCGRITTANAVKRTTHSISGNGLPRYVSRSICAYEEYQGMKAAAASTAAAARTFSDFLI